MFDGNASKVRTNAPFVPSSPTNTRSKVAPSLGTMCSETGEPFTSARHRPWRRGSAFADAGAESGFFDFGGSQEPTALPKASSKKIAVRTERPYHEPSLRQHDLRAHLVRARAVLLDHRERHRPLAGRCSADQPVRERRRER